MTTGTFWGGAEQRASHAGGALASEFIQTSQRSGFAHAKRFFCIPYTMTSDFLVVQKKQKHYVLAIIYKVKGKILDRYLTVFNY